MLSQTYFINEIKFCIEDFFRSMSVESLDEQGDNTLDNKCVAFCTEKEFSFLFFAHQPQAALATINQVVFSLV